MSGRKMSDATTALVAKRFRILGEPLRLCILQELEGGEKTVGELVQALGATQPNVSKHLAILHDAGLIRRRREGNSIAYAIGDPLVFRLCELVCRSETQKSRREYEAWSGAQKRKSKA